MSGRRLDICIASYGNPAGLAVCLASIAAKSRTDWRAIVIQNPHPDGELNRQVDQVLAHAEPAARINVVRMPTNVGYTGAVNEFFRHGATEYLAYCDHDVVIHTDGWDERLASVLDRFHEVGMVFPNGGAYPINRGEYTEILWGVGCCWMLPRTLAGDVGLFDTEIGHHEEVDYQTRVRLQGRRIASAPGVAVHHAAVASSDPASQARISKGVIAWVNKWCAYFGGRQLNYFSPNVLRHEDWPTSALYLEEYFKQYVPELNADPEVRVINGMEYDLIKVPRYKGFYRNRII
jgi:GT2 family glycosyltransferase